MNATGTPLIVQIVHRVLAFLLVVHLVGLAIGLTRRTEPRPVALAAWTTVGIIVLQVLIAGAMIEMGMPLVLRSLHEAAGTLLWLSVCVLAALARSVAPERAEASQVLASEAA